MTNPYFPEIESWQIPEMVVADALEEMAIDGRQGNEGIALFLGRDNNGAAEVTHLVKLRGPGLEKYPDQISIHSSLLNEVTDVALSNKVRLIGQVHSHGPGYGISLSYTDRTYGIKTPYYLSLVAPDYALSSAPLRSWGAHVFMEKQGYVRLNAAEADRRLRIVAGASVPIITVGAENGN
jgi:proteasome lid subunit RPN8/RPN11